MTFHSVRLMTLTSLSGDRSDQLPLVFPATGISGLKIAMLAACVSVLLGFFPLLAFAEIANDRATPSRDAYEQERIATEEAARNPKRVSAPASLDEVFENPRPEARPRVMWMWMGRNVTEQGITRDLESLKDAGFGGAMMFALSDICTPWAAAIGNSPEPGVVAFTDPWWALVRHAAAESKRLGLDFGMGNCPGYETSGGRWIPAELSMQEIIWSKTRVAGGTRQRVPLARPSVDARANQPFPVINPTNGAVEKPVVEDRKTFYRDIAVLGIPAEGNVRESQVVELSAKMDAAGMLEWDVPPGSWEIIRFGHTTKGKLVQPAQWAAMGHECDKMNPAAVEFHLNHVIGQVRRHLGDLIGNPGLTHLHFDSYEAGVPSWTPRMRQEFQARRGYDLLLWLPVLAGREISSKVDTERFKADFKQTISDLYRDVYYPTLQRLCHAAGLELSSEPYGGPWSVAEVVPQLDRVLTEFWTTDNDVQLHGDELVVAAWKHRINIIEAEAFTGSPGMSRWDETPFTLKRMGDTAFCRGVNRMMLHKFPHQPWPDAKPGIVMGQWGTHFSQNQTWWLPGKAWVAYLARAQAVLQWGRIHPLAEGDFSGPAGLQAIRRRDDLSTEVYFVANTTMQRVAGTCLFGVAGRQPELWDPVRAVKRDLPEFETSGGKTSIPLELAPAESFFIVFSKPVAARQSATGANFPVFRGLMEIPGPWELSFDPSLGGPSKPQIFPTLQDWTGHPDPGIRYFSGTASYRKLFDLPVERADLVELDLGAVHHLARVKLNGRDLGVVWTAPWRVAIPVGLLKPKGNELVVEVTNVWANRLVGDEQHPDDCEWVNGPRGNGRYLKSFPEWFVTRRPRPASGRIGFTTWNYFTADSALISSGLLGPVRLVQQD